mgnify:CR=1 FL=1
MSVPHVVGLVSLRVLTDDTMLSCSAAAGLSLSEIDSAKPKRSPPAGAMPFGPFLALGALEAAFFGDAAMARLWSMFGIDV